MEQQMEQTFSMEQTTTFTEQTFSSNQEPQVTVTEQNFSTQSNNLQQPVNEKYQALSSDQMSNLDRPYVAGSGAATDDRFHQHSKLQQKNISELNYRAGHREQILGQRAQTELHGHPEYTHAQQQQINVSDNQYGAKASKMRSQINYGEGAMELTNAQKSAIRMKHEMNRMKESKEWNARGRAFNLEDPLDDVDSRMHAHNQQLRNLAYALGANEDNVDLYMPVTMTQQYQQQKDLKNKLHGGNYEDDARRAAMRPQFDLVQTEGYQSHKKLADTKTAYTQDYYNTKHENQMGKVLAQTAEVQQAAKNAKNLSDTQYKIGAEELRRLVQMNESPELSQARVNAHQLSKKAYKAGYMAMLQAKKDNRKLEDFPEYVQAKKAAAAASQKLYELEAKAMAEHPLGIDNQHYTIQNANKAAEVMNDSKYQKTKGEVIDTMKGYMTMPAEEHPIVTQGNFQKVMQSNALYKKDAADEATEVYFNAAETDHYDSIKKLDPIKSNKKYTLASIEENARPQYQQHETEKYQSDAKRTKLISEYSSIPHEAQGYEKALKETPAMKQAELAKKITSENYYKAGNRRLLEQYKPELDTPINRQSKMNSRIASQKAYKAAYEQLLKNRQEMRDVQGHLEYVNAKKVHEVTSDSLYKAVALKENETPKGVDLETPAIKQVKVNQNTVSDRLYKEGQAEVIAKNKAWQTMDPAGHPIVTQGNYHKAMMSDNNYALESKEDNAEVYYPANLTPGYEQSQTVRPYQSESNYKSDIHKNKDHEFNLATTESYEQNKKLNDVKMNYDKQFKEQQLAGNDYPSGMLQSELYLSQQRAAKNASDAIYTAGAKEIMKRNVLPNDNLYFLNNRKAQQQSSDLKYHEGYNEQVKGKASMNPIDCHLDYLQSAKNQTNMSDAAYQAGGEKIKHNYTMVREDIHIDTPIRVSKHTNQRDYEQSRIDAIKEYKGYMTMPADKHPLVKKAAHDNMLMSQAGYRADWDEDKLNTQYMVNATEHYQQIDNLKETLGSQYTRKATEEREHTNFNAADTQRYQDVLKLQEVNDSNYKKKYNEEISAGKGYMHMPAVTMEMTKNKALDLYRSDNIYSRAAKNLATKYGLTMDDQKMAHQLQVSDITSERLYKKGYNDQMKGKSVQDSGIAYPRYLELAKLARETRDSNYQKGARENLRSHTMGADSMVLAQQKLNSQAVDEYNYSKTRREVIATMKHYQTMDASLHPITLKTNLDRMLYSDAGYRQDWNQDKIEIDFRADGTPGYQQMQDLKPFLSKQEYERKGNKIKSEAKFNPVDTETYETIKNLNAVAGQKYTEKAAKFAEHPIGNANDEMMQISKKLAPILSSHRYTKAAKKLAEKYNISMDDQRIANALKVTDAVNNRIYKAAYQTQMLGKGPQDQKLENYPVEKAQYDLQQKVCDKNYRKHGNEIKMSGKLPLDYMGFTHVKNSAIIASDALYRRSRGDVIAKMKAWQNMDFNLHPLVTESRYLNSLNSVANYTRDAREDMAEAMFLVQTTEGYEQQKKLKNTFDNYTKKAKEIQKEHRYDISKTDTYDTIKKLNEVKAQNYTINAKQVAMKPLADKINNEMIMAKTLAPFSKSLYGKEAKRIQMKYNLDMDDMQIAHSLHCSDIVSKLLYLKGYKHNIQGKGASDSRIENYQTEHQAVQNSKNQSEALYRKAGREVQTTGKLPLDYMEFIRAKKCALIASTADYTKSRDEVIAKHKAWQTMDSASHPLVISAQLTRLRDSNQLYKEEAQADMADIYYPVWLTEGYETARKVTEATSNRLYTKDAEKMKTQHNYNYGDSENYKTSKMMKTLTDKNYTAAAKLANAKDIKPASTTTEMDVAKTLAPFKSTVYDREAKRIAQKFSLTMDSQEIAAALAVSDRISTRLYKKGYNEQVKGQAPKDTSLQSYQTENQAVKNSKAQSIALYKKDGLQLQTTGKLPNDCMEFVRTKKAAIIASDALYQKQRAEAISEHKAWQTMDSSKHPLVIQAQLAWMLQSNRSYRKDAEDAMDDMFFTADQTEFYQQQMALQKVISDANYTRQAQKEKERCFFDYMKTENYELNKGLKPILSKEKYTENAKTAMTKPIPQTETNEMIKAKELLPYSSTHYDREAKRLATKYNISMDDFDIAHSLKLADIVSARVYRQGYQEQMVGKAPSDPSLQSYMNEAKAVENSRNQSIANYVKSGKQIMTTGKLPNDCMEFERIKKNALNMSDSLYRQSRIKAIKDHKAWQTMDSATHPLVVERQIANLRNSHAAYTEEAKQILDSVYYPVFITEGYELAKKVTAATSNAIYKKAAKAIEAEHRFDYSKSEEYQQGKNLNQVKGERYGSEAKKVAMKPIQQKTNEQMDMATRLNPYWSERRYKQAAKTLASKYNLTMDEQVMANSLRVSQLTSANLYKKGYREGVYGTAPIDQSLHSYPAEHNAHNVSKLTSENLYRKDGKAFAMTGKLPNDCMEFSRIKKNAENMSDANYRKSRIEAIKTHNAWQTMDSASHPLVNQKKLAEFLYSDAGYRQDAKDMAAEGIYYPVQITEGYELARKLTRITSQAGYTRDAKRNEVSNKFNFATDSEQYKIAEMHKKLTDSKYTEFAKKEMTRAANEPETAEMRLAQQLSPFWSHAKYVKGAKELATKYNLTMDDQRIALALKITQDVSDRLYKEGYRLTCVGTTSSDLRLENYQSEHNAIAVSKKTSQALYVQEGNKIKTTGKLPVDCQDFVRCDKAAKIASDALYRKTRIDVIKKFRGWQTMDAYSHPVVTENSRKQKLVNHAKYSEEAKEENSWVIYPYQITESYKTAQNNNKNISNKEYSKAAEQSKTSNKFNFADSDDFARAKLGKTLLPHHYERKGKEINAKPLSLAEDSQMELAKTMTDVWSHSKYCQAARALASKYTIHLDDMSIAMALKVNDMYNEKAYKAGYLKSIVGAAPVDPALHSYKNEHHAYNVSKITSDALYRAEGKKQQTTGKLPLDYIGFERSRNQKTISSDALYRQSRIEAIAKYKGWQNMDYSQHPLVLNSAALSLVQSNVLYRADAKEESEGVYFPCHITEGYNLALKVSRVCSDVNYRAKARDESHATIFDYTKTDRYTQVKTNQQILNEQKYSEKAKELNQKPVPQPITAEMVKSEMLKPVLCGKLYTEAAKALQGKYNLSMDVQSIAHSLEVGKKISDRLYKEAYNTQIKGKMTQDAASFPEYTHLKNVTHACSDAEYTKTGREIKTKFNIPLDYPILNLAKQNNLNISDCHYQKQRREVIDQYKGYMRMDANQHPVVLKGLATNLIRSEILYKQAYNEEKDWVYFPYHITEGYNTAKNMEKYQGKNYKQNVYESNEPANKYDATQAVTYETIQKAQEAASNANYGTKAKVINSNYQAIETTPEFELAKSMKSYYSAALYAEEAKRLSGKYTLAMDQMEMARALKMSHDISDRLYRAGYNENIRGHTATNPAIAYPEYQHLAKVTKATSRAEYLKDHEKTVHNYTLCLEYPPFLQAKELSLLLSTFEYKKQFKQCVNDYKGFMRMDSHLHPVVVQGEKISKLFSDNTYKKDWLEEKEWIYFPYHITPGYDQTKLNEKNISDKQYKQKVSYEHKFDLTQTDTYAKDKTIANSLLPAKYSAKAKASMNEFKPLPVTAEMIKSKEINDVLSNSVYTLAARQIKEKYNLDAHDYHLKHNMEVTANFSDIKYKEAFEKQIKGLFPTDTKIAYPEYEWKKQVNENQSDALYRKDADAKMHSFTIKEDYPMFKHAVDAYKNISDLQYTKGRYEAVKDMKGFQRMDAAQHPVVQRGQQVYKIISTRKYIEDWMEEKEYIYFPVQITEAYNNSIRVSKYQSNLTYQAGYQRFKYENTFQYDKTPGYQFSLDLSNKISDAIYRKQAKAEMEGKRWAAHLTPKCIYDNELKELLSNENYKRNARKVMDTYSVDMHLPYIQNSIAVTKFVSHTRYTENYRKNVLGKFIATTFADYPEYGHALAVSRNQSEPLYKEAALKNHCKYTLVADQHQFLQAKEHTKLMSSDYGKGKRDAIETMKGFMRMDATIHPVVVEGTKKHKLMSDIKYKEDYNMDKDWNMYTFTITPVYEQHQKNKANAFEKNYTDAAKKGNETVKFNVHETEMHQNKMATQKLVGDKLYQKDKYDLQGYSTCNSNEHEMYLFKEIAPLLSAKRYCAVAKDLLGKYHLEVDNPTMVSAFQAQALTSEAMYRKKYMKEVLGKFCDIKDAEMFNQYKCVAELVSDNLYRKKAISGMGIYASNQINPDMQHCIEVMKIVSDKEYTKNLKDVQKKFSAFSRQRLEHSPNLEFQRQIQAQVSSYEYKRDYEEEKNYVYFPVHITEGYSLAMKCSKFFSNKFYKEKYMKDRNERSNYLFTHTPSYEFQKTINESIYRGNYQKKYLETRDKNNYNCIDDPVSLQAREISQIISNNLYNAEAKKMLQNYNLSVDNPALLHAKACQKLTSENNYKQWLKHPDAAHHSMGLDEWVLRFTIDHAKSISNWRYKADAKKLMSSIKVPGDLPEYKFHRELQTYLSDKNYTSGAEQAIKTALGFTRLAVDEMKQLKLNLELTKLNSDRLYKADYYDDRGFNMYPITITQFYEVCKNNEKLNSDQTYKKKDADKSRNQFKYTDTGKYAVDKIQDQNNDRIYRKDLKEMALKPRSDVRQEIEYQHIKTLKPLLSKNAYIADAKAIQHKYHLDMSEMSAQHIKKISKLNSDIAYKQPIKSKGFTNLVESPYYKHIKDTMGLLDSNAYRKESKKLMSKVSMPFEFPSLVTAQQAMKAISNASYAATKEQALKNFMGFTKLPIKDLKLLNIHMNLQQALSDKEYKGDWLGWLKGNKLSMHDTPELKHYREQQKKLSDVEYKRKFHKEAHRGLTSSNTPTFDHIKNLSKIQSVRLYKKDAEKNLETWASGMYKDMPDAILAKEQVEYHDSRYRAQYKKEMIGQKSDMPTIQEEHAKEIQKTVGDLEYKKQFRAEKGNITEFHKLAETRDHQHHKQQHEQVSDRKYVSQWNKDKTKATVPHEGWQVQADIAAQKDVSLNGYKKKSPLELDKYKGYFRNLLDTPAIRFQYKAKEWFSNTEYTKEWNEDRHFICFPYWLTDEYKSHQKVKGAVSNYNYRKDARSRMDKPQYTTTDNLIEKHAQKVQSFLDERKYKQDFLNARGEYTPSGEYILKEYQRAKDAQSLLTSAAEQAELRKICQEYHLDEDFIKFKHCKHANEIASDILYKGTKHRKINDEIKETPFYQGTTKIHEHYKHVKGFQSDIKYKQDLFTAQGHVTQIHDEPWVKHHRELQQHISVSKYPDEKALRVSNYLPERFIKHIGSVMKNISEVNYREDYKDELLGNNYPTPFRRDYEHFKAASKVISQRMYRQHISNYKSHVTADAVEIKQQKKAMELASNLKYNDKKQYQKHKLDEVGGDTPWNKHFSEMRDLTSEELYKRHAKRDMQEIHLPEEGDLTQQIASKNSKIASNLLYQEEAKKQLERTCHLYNGKDHEHMKYQRDLMRMDTYQKEAKTALKRNTAGVTPFIAKQIEAQKNCGIDKDYKRGYEELQRNYKASDELTSRQVRESAMATKNISNLEYKQEYEDSKGNCFGVPLLHNIQKQVEKQKMMSNHNYKQDADTGVISSITNDSKQMEPAKIASKLADMKYRTADHKKHNFNPESKKEMTELLSDAKYKAKQDSEKYTVVLDTPDLIRIRKQKELAETKYRTRPAFKGINQSIQLSQEKQAQLAASDKNYKDAMDNRPAYAKMEDNLYTKVATNTAKHCSDVNYRSKLHKGVNFETAEMKKAREAQDIASNLKYKTQNGKYTFDNQGLYDTHLRKQKELTSNLAYKKGMAKNFTASAERADLTHLKNIKNLASTAKYRQDANFTITTDTPAFNHYKKANKLSSDNAYKTGAKSGNGWFPEDSIAYSHYNEAQSMMHSKDYKNDAAKIMHSGGALQVSSIEEYPSIKHASHATELVSDIKYKQRPKAMFNPLDTPGMDHIRYAEKIKSGQDYKKSYTDDVYGRAAINYMDTPEMQHALTNKNLNSNKAYREKYEQELRGRAMASLDTPEMRRIKQAQGHVSDKLYKDQVFGITPQTCLDTPEYRRIKSVKNLNSDIHYREQAQEPVQLQARHQQSRGLLALNTPEYNRVKNNTKNMSDIRYKDQREHTGMLGGMDMRTMRALQLSKIQSEAKYKDIVSQKEKHDRIRSKAINAQQVQRYDAPKQKRPSGVKNSRLSKKVQERSVDTSFYSDAADYADDVTVSRKWTSYRANPGSIYDYDPTETEDNTEDEQRSRRRPKNRKAKFAESTIQEVDEDFDILQRFQQNPSNRTDNPNARSWMDYLQGEYKHVAPSNHVDRANDILGDAVTLVNISREQVEKAKEEAAMKARQDEQENIANMYAKQEAKEQAQFNKSTSRVREHKESRLNLSSYGYTTDYTDFSESGYDHDVADASATCDSEIESIDSLKVNTFVAMYPYQAQEEDELSFAEGDYLDECQFIGEGWMFGYNRKTGESGMLPANYVESVNI